MEELYFSIKNLGHSPLAHTVTVEIDLIVRNFIWAEEPREII